MRKTKKDMLISLLFGICLLLSMMLLQQAMQKRHLLEEVKYQRSAKLDSISKKNRQIMQLNDTIEQLKIQNDQLNDTGNDTERIKK